MRHVALISTGGTIEKTYDEHTGRLENRVSIVHRMLARLRLEDIVINSVQLLSKDSNDLTDADRRRIVDMTRIMLGDGDFDKDGDTDGVVILHGTDTLHVTGELLLAEIPDPPAPIILTGAMRPFEMKSSDALQNLTEAIFATGALSPGVYAVAHGRALRFPGVVKDRTRGTFCMGAG
ncbi:MAG: asparaginase [Phycisphaerae bacterium]|nr:asparaginase [Phycisphaerae bacterium]